MPVAPDAQTPAGTANELAKALGGERSANLVWSTLDSSGERSSEVATVLTVEAVSDATSARLVNQLPVDAANADSCGPFLEFDATLHFVTTDGAFLDEFSGTLQGSATANSGSFDGTSPVAEHRGSCDLMLLQRRIPNLTLVLHTVLLPDVSGILSGEDSSNIDDGFMIAFWPESLPINRSADSG